MLGCRGAGEGAAGFTGDAVGIYDGRQGDGDAVFHARLQVRDHVLLFVGQLQAELCAVSGSSHVQFELPVQILQHNVVIKQTPWGVSDLQDQTVPTAGHGKFRRSQHGV